jgi:hypothetical protein
MVLVVVVVTAVDVMAVLVSQSRTKRSKQHTQKPPSSTIAIKPTAFHQPTAVMISTDALAF